MLSTVGAATAVFYSSVALVLSIIKGRAHWGSTGRVQSWTGSCGQCWRHPQCTWPRCKLPHPTRAGPATTHHNPCLTRAVAQGNVHGTVGGITGLSPADKAFGVLNALG